MQKHFRFAVIARNKDSVGFVLYSILEPEIDRRGFTGPLEQDCLGLTLYVSGIHTMTQYIPDKWSSDRRDR